MTGENLLPYDGICELVPEFIHRTDQERIFTYLRDNIPFRPEKIQIFGRWITQPRLMVWSGDPGITYRYSGKTFTPISWDPIVLQMKMKIESELGHCFSSALINYYRDQNDYMGPHSDDEKELGINPIIASISFGQKRRFRLKHKITKNSISVELSGGDLLVMKGQTQRFWKHQLPRTARPLDGRINITFRKIYSK